MATFNFVATQYLKLVPMSWNIVYVNQFLKTLHICTQWLGWWRAMGVVG